MKIKGRSSTCFGEDVVVEILSRLPVKSLLRFMCVSKDWRALITSSYFNDVHLQRSDPNLSLLFSKKKIFPVGSSSGLVCIGIWDPLVKRGLDIVIWNPATKKFRFLPHRDDHYLLGFEFFHDTRDYKVVSIRQFDGLDGTIRANVFTSSTNSWRQVESCYRCLLYGPLFPITLNGVLYMLLYITKEKWHVLSFNLRDEVFRVILSPESDGPLLLSWKNSLAFLGGRLDKPGCELWVMTEEPSACATQITWVKQFILQTSSLPRPILGYWKDEYLLGCDISGELHCYDLASQRLTRLPKHDHTDGTIYENAVNYVESLLSVD